MLLLLDNRDSFTFNLAQAFLALGTHVEVRAARRTSLKALLATRPSHLVIGPGPGHPETATRARELLLALAPTIPTLGVCLGFQVMGLAFGARIARAREPLHGGTVRVRHDGRGVFAGLSPTPAFARYNSLGVLEDGLPACLEVSARSEQDEPLALRHRAWPLEGVLFHPESVLSEEGPELLANFLRARA